MPLRLAQALLLIRLGSVILYLYIDMPLLLQSRQPFAVTLPDIACGNHARENTGHERAVGLLYECSQVDNYRQQQDDREQVMDLGRPKNCTASPAPGNYSRS